jgi:hypothetical protein
MTMSRLASGVVLVLALAIMGAVIWVYTQRGEPELPLPPPAPQASAPQVAPAEDKPIEHPIEEAPAAQPLPALADSDNVFADALTQLFGAAAVKENFIVQGGVRRAVATIDNLTREKLPQQQLPVKPVGGEFKTTMTLEGPVIGADNAQRYVPYVKLVESIDSAKAARLYAQMYPLFQQAYRELGYPKGYFNDRLVQVIDHLLLAPEPAGPVRLTQPKVRYEFADPDLAALSAGQKALVRMGPENARRVKGKLRELRAAVAKPRQP